MKKQFISPDTKGVMPYLNQPVSKKLTDNMDIMRQIFSDDDTIIFREFESQTEPKVRFFGVAINGMIKAESVYQSIIRPLTLKSYRGTDPIVEACDEIVSSIDIKKKQKLGEIVEAVLYGDTAVFAEGSDSAILVETKGWQMRSVSEPDNEKNLKGPREGFTEAIIVNAALIRRKIQTSDLKFSFRTAGTRSNTRICLVYMDSLIDKKVLRELIKRLDKIEIDGILDANYIEELTRDSKFSPFKTTGSTEKPDIVAARLLEGRVAVIIDGSPIVMTVPYLFIENFQSPDDYYLGYYFASLGRIIRILGFFISFTLPSVYLALVAYHPAMLPTPLIMAISSASKGIPFPTFIECILMLFIFEILRETGIRMSSKTGQALSIVGGLVVGQAAVEAKIVSAPMVIIVALTGITGLLVERLSGATLLLRILSLISTALLGFPGFFLFLSVALIYVLSLESFGYEYVDLSWNFQSMKDRYFRAPFQYMKTRPIFARDKYREKHK